MAANALNRVWIDHNNPIGLPQITEVKQQTMMQPSAIVRDVPFNVSQALACQ